MRLLATGATGFVGGRLVPALLEAGRDVTVPVRDRERYGRTDVEVLPVDLTPFDDAGARAPRGAGVNDGDAAPSLSGSVSRRALARQRGPSAIATLSR